MPGTPFSQDISWACMAFVPLSCPSAKHVPPLFPAYPPPSPSETAAFLHGPLPPYPSPFWKVQSQRPGRPTSHGGSAGE